MPEQRSTQIDYFVAARKENFFGDKWTLLGTAKYCNKLILCWNKQAGIQGYQSWLGTLKLFYEIYHEMSESNFNV